MSVESFENLPVGEGKKLEATKETLPVVEVANEVVYVNPAFEKSIPFNLKVGEATNLGIFLTPSEQDTERRVEVNKLHQRAGVVGRVVFQDKERRLYRDVDLKGIGYLGMVEGEPGEESQKLTVKPVKPQGTQGEGVWGLLGLHSAMRAKDMEEQLLELGVHTTRTVSIIELKEIVDENGNKISIEEAKEKKIVPENYTPALQMRAFGTRARFEDVEKKVHNAEVLLEDGKKLVAQEMGKEKISNGRYLDWLVDVLAKNLAIMHKNGYAHGNLHGQNITLDGRITDLESVKSPETPKKKAEAIKEDLEDMKASLVAFAVALGTKIPYLRTINPLRISELKFPIAYRRELNRMVDIEK